jgi:dTDP-4-dehydrorhamnose reductase
VNGGAPRAFAEGLQDTGGQLLQVSTDVVFNGRQGSPYRPEQARDPLWAYGASKAAGEAALEELLTPSGCGVILRTSWVMGPVGGNLALTMLRLHREHACSGKPAHHGGVPHLCSAAQVFPVGLLRQPPRPRPGTHPLAPGPAPAAGGSG